MNEGLNDPAAWIDEQTIEVLESFVDAWRDDADDYDSESGNRSSYTSHRAMMKMVKAAYLLGREREK